MPPLPAARRYSIRVRNPDGEERRLGKMRVQSFGPDLQVLTRTGEVAASWPIVESQQKSSTWILTAEDGTVITLASCNCGS